MSTSIGRFAGRVPTCLIAAATVSAVIVGGCTKSIESTPTPVVLAAALSQGDSPWTQSVAEVVDLSSVVTLDARVGSGGSPQSFAATAGLYGGSTSQTVCDVPRLVSFLEAEPNKADAWRTVLGVRDIRSYVATLQPVVVMKDTMVTDHGFDDGRATDQPTVLQAGTAILLDPDWVPRVRCASGSPLTPPPPVEAAAVTYTGQPWPAFHTDQVVQAPRESTPTTWTDHGSTSSHIPDSGSPAGHGTTTTAPEIIPGESSVVIDPPDPGTDTDGTDTGDTGGTDTGDTGGTGGTDTGGTDTGGTGGTDTGGMGGTDTGGTGGTGGTDTGGMGGTDTGAAGLGGSNSSNHAPAQEDSSSGGAGTIADGGAAIATAPLATP